MFLIPGGVNATHVDNLTQEELNEYMRSLGTLLQSLMPGGPVIDGKVPFLLLVDSGDRTQYVTNVQGRQKILELIRRTAEQIAAGNDTVSINPADPRRN